jgi:hypothetical protein
MDKQLSFFDRPEGRPVPALKRTDTRREAADSMGRDAPRLRRLVWEYIAAQGQAGATDQECQEALNLESNTQGPRRIELAKSGHVADSGQRRPTRKGRNAIVWVATGKPL